MPRDHAAEYARRVERGIEQGFTRAQARGHPEESHLPSIRESRRAERELRDSERIPDVLHLPDGRTVIRTTDAAGNKSTAVTTKRRYDAIDDKPDAHAHDYRKRKR